MTDYLMTFLGIYFICLFKFIGGPILGKAAGYSIPEVVLVTVMGLMTSVLVFTYVGSFLRIRYNMIFEPNRKLFTTRNRRIVKVWQKSGAIGIAAITPLILSPIVGALVINAFGVKKTKVFIYMFVSGVIWALFFALTIDEIMSLPIISSLFKQPN